MQKRLGVNVVHTTSNLNQIYGEIQALLHAVSKSCDFLMKVDTDEFMALSNDKGQLQVTGIREYLDWMPVNGSKYVVDMSMNLIPPQKTICINDDPAMETRFTLPEGIASGYRKTFFAAPTFESTDLGGHTGVVRAPFNNDHKILSALSIVHYHNQCYERMMHNTLKAVASHGYVSSSDTTAVQLKKCEKLTGGYQGRECNVPSCHKIWQYMAHLYNTTESRLNYLTTYSGAEKMDFHVVRDLVKAKLKEFEYSK